MKSLVQVQRDLFLLLCGAFLMPSFYAFSDVCSDCDVPHALPVDCYYENLTWCEGSAMAREPVNGTESYVQTLVDTSCDACCNEAGSEASFSYTKTSGSKWTFCLGLEIPIAGWKIKPNGCYEQNSQESKTESGKVNCKCNKIRYTVKEWLVPETIPIETTISKSKLWLKYSKSECDGLDAYKTTKNDNCGVVNSTATGFHYYYEATSTNMSCATCAPCTCKD